MKTYIVFFLIGFTIFISCGCSSWTGNKVDTQIAPDFKPNQYKYFNIISKDDNSFGAHDVDMALYSLGLRLYRSEYEKANTINVYTSSYDGLCLPPFLNPHVSYFMIFYEPKEVTLEIKDATTDELLFSCHYWRGVFSSGANPTYIRNVIKESIYKAWKKSPDINK